ncbi:type I-E CRISPR-associated protein Cas6/Cse3/CasE [Thermobifida cellulosilytica]|mgnify:CR=1 FL=1|uniref:CRISPR-associated protein Cse3 n=1 Tax=Thermobifida cellulosilytica TB100 TaxID=665004 RepID=A0A147KKF8_THECS|nr:type I-E CRISPR-associated protein Cas6/Cse3/CasE [Thermobifida cellulosilytica]KUP97777.1 CRISPR-associated protein Cse3 [Thermobifida cellulosilytica TB100]
MTWLTKIVPDLRNHQTRADFRTAGDLHRKLVRLSSDLGEERVANPSQQSGLLFRVEETRAGLHLLVQSRSPLRLDRIGPGYYDVQTRDLDPFLARLEKGNYVRYRIVASPTKRLGKSEKNTQRLELTEAPPKPKEYTRALRGAEADEWWRSRAAANGLELRSAYSQALDDVRDPGTTYRSRKIWYPAVRFEGDAVISDADAVRVAVLKGIGRGKSYGCGLLSLALVEG